jgi:hypothetical protein
LFLSRLSLDPDPTTYVSWVSGITEVHVLVLVRKKSSEIVDSELIKSLESFKYMTLRRYRILKFRMFNIVKPVFLGEPSESCLLYSIKMSTKSIYVKYLIYGVQHVVIISCFHHYNDQNNTNMVRFIYKDKFLNMKILPWH